MNYPFRIHLKRPFICAFTIDRKWLNLETILIGSHLLVTSPKEVLRYSVRTGKLIISRYKQQFFWQEYDAAPEPTAFAWSTLPFAHRTPKVFHSQRFYSFLIYNFWTFIPDRDWGSYFQCVFSGPFLDPGFTIVPDFDNDPVIIVADPYCVHNMRMRIRIQHYRTFSFRACCQKIIKSAQSSLILA